MPLPTSRARRARSAFAALVFATVAGCAEGVTEPVTVEPPPPTARWSDAASWPGGVVPAAGADVTIPAGTSILLDVSPPPLGTLVVDGTLEFDRRDLALTAGRIQVAGTLRVGTETRPFAERAIITLTNGLGLSTVAEGIETEEDLDVVQALGCEHAQGYLLGRPALLSRPLLIPPWRAGDVAVTAGVQERWVT